MEHFEFLHMILLMVTSQVPPQVAGKYGKRWFGVGQENCLYAAHALLCRHPPANPQYMLEIIQHRPEVIDKLLECAAQPKQPWYPENTFDSTGKIERSWLLGY